MTCFTQGSVRIIPVNDRLARLIKREGNRDFMTTLLDLFVVFEFSESAKGVGGEVKLGVVGGETDVQP
jgi:hypothetical protein